MRETLPATPTSQYLKPTFFLDADAESVQSFVQRSLKGSRGDRERGVKLFYAVRDTIRYDPYRMIVNREDYRASAVLRAGAAFCVPKAILLAAVARAAGIPSALGFADVRNHLNSAKLRQKMGTDIFTYHGYAILYLCGRWIKATPAFNLSLCEKFGVKPLEFDGKSDALFHPYDKKGRRHMEYVRDHGSFADFPYKRVLQAFLEFYPRLTSAPLEREQKTVFEEEKPLLK